MSEYSVCSGLKRIVCDTDRGVLSFRYGDGILWECVLEDSVFCSSDIPCDMTGNMRVRSYGYSPAGIYVELVSGVTDVRAELRISAVRHPWNGEEDLGISIAARNAGSVPVGDFACGLRLRTDSGSVQKITIPHVIYNDNPSSSPDRIVPHIGRREGLGLIVEEHRLPIPAVNVEWDAGDTGMHFTLMTLPEIRTGDDADYWSLGALYGAGGTAHTVVVASGPLMFNGMADTVYGGQGTPLPYENGYRTLLPGESVSRNAVMDFGPVEKGRGFEETVKLAYRALNPSTVPAHTFREMIGFKKAVADSRYRCGEAPGYSCFGSANSFGNRSGRPDYYLYAWTGQALRIAWGEMKCGIADNDPGRFERAAGTVDFFVRGTEGRTPGLMRCYFLPDSGEWGGSWDDPEARPASRMEGEALFDLIDILDLLKKSGKGPVPVWEALAERALGFLCLETSKKDDGTYPARWEYDGRPAPGPDNSSGLPCVSALVRGYSYFGNREYLEMAEAVFGRYYEKHMKTFDRPFSGATFDAECEDKEAGIYAFISASELWYATGNGTYREAADAAAYWILTFVYFWETGFLPGTQCEKKGFRIIGWPGVSVQNHHLDVFFPSYELYEYGNRTGNRIFSHMGLTVAWALTHGVCTYPGEWGFDVVGEQGEQYYHTNYFQAWYPDILEKKHYWRGNMRTWNPSWITAQVFRASLRFRDSGNI